MNDLDSIKRDIKDRVAIDELIGRYIRLERSGRNSYKCLCPFHDDSTPSMSIVPDKQFYHCFTCGAGGDIFKFLVDYEGISFGEALKKLAHEAGVELKQTDQKKRDRLEQLYDIMKSTDAYYRSNITNQKALKYLSERDIDLEWAKDFGIGFATENWEGLKNYLLSNGHQISLIKSLGLVSESNGKSFDKFRNRLLLPFKNDSGYVVGYTGRVIEEDPNSEVKLAKYMNSPESDIYHKGKILFGFNKSKDAIREAKEVIIVEGNLDFISLYYRGVKNVVAISGTAFSDEQAMKIKRLADNAILMLDSDSAGQKASLKMVGVLLSHDIAVEGVSLPETEDPDSYIKKVGVEGFKNFVKENKVNFLEYEKNIYDKIYPNGLPIDIKISLIKRATEISSFIKDEMVSLNVKYEMRRLLDIGEKEFEEYQKIINKKQSTEPPKVITNFGTINKDTETKNIPYQVDNSRDYLATYLTFLLKYPKYIGLLRDEVIYEDLGEDWNKMYGVLFELFSVDDNKHIEMDFDSRIFESEIPKEIINKYMQKVNSNEFKFIDKYNNLVASRSNPVDTSDPMHLITAKVDSEIREKEIAKLEDRIEVTFREIIKNIHKVRRKRRSKN